MTEPQQPSPDQQHVIELMQSLTEYMNEGGSAGYTKAHFLSAFLNLAALIAVESGAKGKEYEKLARRMFNEMRDAMRPAP